MGTVELFTIDRPSPVVDFCFVAFRGRRAFASLDDSVLQAAGRHLDAGLLSVCGEIIDASFLGDIRLGRALGLFPILIIFPDLIEDFFGLLLVHQFVFRQVSRLDAFGELGEINLDFLVAEIAANLQTNSVAEALFF